MAFVPFCLAALEIAADGNDGISLSCGCAESGFEIGFEFDINDHIYYLHLSLACRFMLQVRYGRANILKLHGKCLV